MFVYQVILLPWLLLAFRLADAQNLINVQSVNCMQSSISQCQSLALGASNNVIINVLSGCPTLLQSTPCSNQLIGCNVHGQQQTTPCINSTSLVQPQAGCNQSETNNNSIPKQPGDSSPVKPQPTPSSNHPATPYPPIQPRPTLCPNHPVTNYPPVEAHTTSSTTPNPITSAPDRPTSLPPPEQIHRCPEGTVLLHGKCRTVYCGSGIPVSGRCVQPRCSPGTTWTGLKCAPPSPIELAPIYFERTIINEKANNLPDVVINNVQNLMVNASIVIPQNREDYEEEYDDKSEDKTLAPKCCTVVAPRVCRCQGKDRVWQCYNKKQKICSDFCTASKVVIKPSKLANWHYNGNELITIPPEFDNNCRTYGNCTQAADWHDCSGCTTGQMMSCSTYCFMYRCSSQNCAFYDQQEFCKLPQFAKSIGCLPEDGWNR